jgi:hypothetical protein
MNLSALIAWTVAGGAAAYAALVSLAKQSSSTPASPGVAPGQQTKLPAAESPLSQRRQQALALVSEVVPSRYGDTRFAKLAPGYAPDLPQFKAPFTTCGYLPCYVGRGLRLEKAITQCGLEQARMNARGWGAWVEPGDGKDPRPGDVFCVDQPAGNLVIHVGVFIGKNPDGSWRTADAGQGDHDHQEAKFLDRAYAPPTLGAPARIGGPAGLRRLAGWVDLDKVPETRLS